MLVNGIVASFPTVGSAGTDPNFIVDQDLNRLIDQGGNFITWKGLPFPPPFSSMYLDLEEFEVIGPATFVTDLITDNLANIFPNTFFGNPAIDPLQPSGLSSFQFSHGKGGGQALSAGQLDYDGQQEGLETGTFWAILKADFATDLLAITFAGAIASRKLEINFNKASGDWKIDLRGLGGVPNPNTITPIITFPTNEYFILAVNSPGVGLPYTATINGADVGAFSGGTPTQGTWFHSPEVILPASQSDYAYLTDGDDVAILCLGVTTEILETDKLLEMLAFATQ